MRRFLTLFFICFLTAGFGFSLSFDGYSDAPGSAEGRQLYTSVTSLPETIFKGEIFALELRSVVTTEGFQALEYRFDLAEGLELLNSEPERRHDDHTYYDRFYFKALSDRPRLPDITPVLKFSDFYEQPSESIPGKRLNVTVLNPPKEFCGILADRFTIVHTKTTAYDSDSNILVLMADANRSDLGDFRIQNAEKQDFESLNNGLHGSTMTYYAVLPAEVDTLNLSYFNLQKRAYERLSIPIIVDDDSVSTQSDLKPTEYGHIYIKTLIFGGIALLFFVLFLLRRSKVFLLIAVAAAAYTAWKSAPIRHICIKEGSPIYLLPLRNATVFEIAPQNYRLEVQGHIEEYTKVKLLNDKIGWVKDDDTCTR